MCGPGPPCIMIMLPLECGPSEGRPNKLGPMPVARRTRGHARCRCTGDEVIAGVDRDVQVSAHENARYNAPQMQRDQFDVNRSPCRLREDRDPCGPQPCRRPSHIRKWNPHQWNGAHPQVDARAACRRGEKIEPRIDRKGVGNAAAEPITTTLTQTHVSQANRCDFMSWLLSILGHRG